MGNEMMEAYLFEMDTLLEQLDSLVMEAESEKTFTQDHVNEIFRIMHTIKGSSAMMEFNSLMTIAHRIEDLFFVIRDKTMDAVPEELRPELFDMIFKAIDFFRGEIEKIKSGEPLNTSIDTFLDTINTFANKISGAAEEEKPSAPAAESAGGDTPADETAYGSAEFPYGIHVFFDEGIGMENLRGMVIVNAVKDFCDESQFDFYPADIKLNPDSAAFIVENGFFVRFRTAEDRDRAIPAVREQGSVRTFQTFDTPLPPPPAPAASESAPAAPAAQSAPAEQSAPAQGAAQSAAKQGHVKESLISVNLSKLDHLMSVVSEIVITESMVTASPDLKGLKLDKFNQSARQLRSLTDELQDVSMSLRMIPVSGTFQKQRRTVRDMCKKLGKQANLILEGENTEIDKTIVDSISDPIMHIVRNSMDHGIETPDVRVAAGKDPTGQIVLSAHQTGSEVIVQISDDGAGADDDAILSKAIRQGIAQPGVEYSHRDILNFLLMPGFSTNTEVTEYSGRGVGTDVVKSNVESVGGTVTVASEKGKGMTTTLNIPLTMAIMDGMEVACGGSIFTVPINSIQQIFKVAESDIIHDAVRGEMIKIMDNFYSIVRAKDFFSLGQGVDSVEEGILLWVGTTVENSFCLFMDELIGEQQVVVKPLPSFINDFGIKDYGISGCTILGDGSISIILDVSSIYSAAGNG